MATNVTNAPSPSKAWNIGLWGVQAAGAGLTTVMVLAAGYHVMHAEYPAIAFNAVLGLLAAFVAWGRLSKAPIAPRN